MEERLIELRRKRGLSQEALADLLGVSRQAVSKWENGSATPELPKLIALSELYAISLDELALGRAARNPTNPASSEAVIERLDTLERKIDRQRLYEYKSKHTLWGVPLVHVKFAYGRNQLALAKGIIAVGNAAVGVVALGGLACGAISFGGVSLGLLLGLGGVALGGIAWGGVALGVYAMGGCAIGLQMAMGGVAIARDLAVGGIASARVAVGGVVNGEHTLRTAEASREVMEQFIRANAPGIPGFVARALALVGAAK